MPSARSSRPDHCERPAQRSPVRRPPASRGSCVRYYRDAGRAQPFRSRLTAGLRIRGRQTITAELRLVLAYPDRIPWAEAPRIPPPPPTLVAHLRPVVRDSITLGAPP